MSLHRCGKKVCASLSAYHTSAQPQEPRCSIQTNDVILAHPNVLAYKASERLKPALDYLAEIGVTNLGE
eukprot:3665460-Pyramimonas_sp.AAC.2